MYASIAGLKAHMQKLSVIGNNVANVNTQGYKKQRTVFRDSVYRLYSGGTNGTSTIGGMNPSQLGYGSMIGSIDLDMSSSSYNPGNPMDCALVGDGFFLVGTKDVAMSIDPTDPDSFKALTLTRVGDFKFGPDGYLVDGKGNVVYGFMNTGTGSKRDPNDNSKTIPDISDQLVPIRLPRWEKVPTGEYDDDGNAKYKYEIRYATTKPETTNGTGEANENAEGPLRDLTPKDLAGENADANADLPDSFDFAEFSSISIDAGTGAITGICREGSQVVTIGYLAVGSVTNPNGVSHIGNSYYRCQEGAGDLRICMLGGVQKDLGINYINKYLIDRAIAGNNQAGNGQAGNGTGEGNDYRKYSGAEIVSTGGTEMLTGFLEAPNTDLAEEISELITTQRGYQANTRIVTVTDSMLEELVNMKR